MIAYKLCRIKKNGDITPLFINKTQKIEFNKWLNAESHPTKNYKLRPYWHCVQYKVAPHLSKKNRVWVKVEIEDFQEFQKPISQGGVWYLANKIKFIKVY